MRIKEWKWGKVKVLQSRNTSFVWNCDLWEFIKTTSFNDRQTSNRKESQKYFIFTVTRMSLSRFSCSLLSYCDHKGQNGKN
ncbi:CLUMA_CG002736, isoform A [Clunio marinus]|uniref:CLUMA_CG002736, isoform A n=1 Tax=Clunio marinus TaxID=568069 RepID=A0A1J1HLL8_9DIPT|nr:CLUMA_CG002736, isoform A [Clunio marinus]